MPKKKVIDEVKSVEAPYDKVSLKFSDVAETKEKKASTKKKVTEKESLQDYTQAQKELQEAFENLSLSNAELSALAEKGLKSLKSIGDIIKKAHELTPEEKEDFLIIKKIIKAKKQEADNPKVQLTKIKKIIGDTPNIDTEAAINNILEEVMALVPEGMSYFEFMKEYRLVAKPRVSFFARLFNKNK